MFRLDNWILQGRDRAGARQNAEGSQRPYEGRAGGRRSRGGRGAQGLLTRPVRVKVKERTIAATVNSTRCASFGRLEESGLDVEVASGGRTKGKRHQLHVPKAHCLNAACVGQVDAAENGQQRS